MRKTAKILCILLVVVQVFSLSSAFALQWTQDQVIRFIEATAIDGTKVFTNAETFTFNSPNKSKSVPMKGAILCWFKDSKHGELWLIGKDQKTVYAWRKVEKKYFGVIMQVLIPMLSDYLDYNSGEVISYVIAPNEKLEEPLLWMGYTESPWGYEGAFTDSKKFCEDAKYFTDNLIE